MTERNYIYRTEWIGKFTKWNYRLDVILPPIGYIFGLPFDNPTIIALPPGAVELKKSKVAYKDYIIGLPETPSMNIDIDFDLLNGSQYSELKNAIFEESPIMHTLGSSTDLGSRLVHSGIVFDLTIMFNGNDETTGLYRSVRTGIYQSDGKIKLDAKNKVISIEAVDINRVILSSITFNEDTTNNATLISDDKAIEMKWTDNSTVYQVWNHNWTVYYKYMQYSDFINRIQETGTAIKRILLRDNSYVFTLTPNLPTFYRQITTDATGNKGAELLTSELYLLVNIETNPIGDLVDGLASDMNKNSLQNIYPNGAYDFFAELAEFNLTQAKLGTLGVTFTPIVYSTIDLDLKTIKTSSIELKYEQFKTLTSSCYEIKSDETTGGDIEKYEATIEGGRNEASWTIPIVFSNLSPNVKYLEFNNTTKYKYSPKTHNLYYLENNELYKVHEWAKFKLWYDETGGKTSDDYNVFTPIPRNTYGIKQVERTILATQVESGIPKILANTLKALLQNGLDKVEIEIPIDEFVSFISGGGGNGFVWNLGNNYEYTFTLNIAEIFDITYTKNKWKMMSSEIDYFSETAKVELININV